jgi:multidrug efflux pump subunit AcrA (membrane-fusion protein)
MKTKKSGLKVFSGRWAAAIFLALGVCALLAANTFRQADSPLPQTRVERRTWRPATREIGLLEARYEAPVFSRLPGNVGFEVIWKIEEGAEVAEGEAVLRLDDRAVREDWERTKEEWAGAETVLRQREREAELLAAEHDLLVRRAELEAESIGAEFDDLKKRPTPADKRRGELRLNEAQLREMRATRRAADVKSLLDLGFAGQAEYDQALLESAQAEAALAEATQLHALLIGGPTKNELRQAELKNADARQRVVTAKVAHATATASALARIELARADADVIQRRLNVKQKELEETIICAPCAGRVAFVDVWKGAGNLSPIQLGERVQSGWLVCKVADTSALRVRVLMTEADAVRLPEQAAATVTLAAFPRRIFSAKRLPAPLTSDDRHLLMPKPALLRFGEAFVNAVEVRFEFDDLQETERRILRLGMTAEVCIFDAAPRETTLVAWKAVAFAKKLNTGETAADPYVLPLYQNDIGAPLFIRLGDGDENWAELPDGPPPGTALVAWHELTREQRARLQRKFYGQEKRP